MLSHIPLLLIWTAAFVALAAIVFSVVMTIRNIFKGNKRQKIFNAISLVCVLVMAVSWFMNFGWLRFVLTFIPLPVVHIGAFLLICGFAVKYSQKKIDIAAIFAQITFVLAYLLLPDGGDAGEMYVLFGQIRSNTAASVCGGISSTLMKINIVLLVVLLINGNKAKKKITAGNVEEA